MNFHTLTPLRAANRVLENLHHLDSILALLSRSYAGEIPNNERGSDEHVAGCILFLKNLLDRTIAVAADQPADVVPRQAFRELCHARSVVACLDAAVSADANDINFSSEVLCWMIFAIENCVERAAAWMEPEGRDIPGLFAYEENWPGRVEPSVSTTASEPPPSARRARQARSAVAA